MGAEHATRVHHIQPAGDLSTRTHVHDLVVAFYREVVFDDVLAPVFVEVAEVDWAEHIPHLVDYWCGILLGEARAPSTTVATHRRLHDQQALRPEHCDRWWSLWEQCIAERWSGPTAEAALTHAASLMASMAKHVFGYHWQPAGTPTGRAGVGARADG